MRERIEHVQRESSGIVITDHAEAESFRIKYLGTKGLVKQIMGEMKNVPNEQKKEFGQKVNDLKQAAEGRFNTISTLLKTEIAPVSFKKYPIAILQFNYDRDFAHVNFVCKEASTSNSKKIAGKVTQINSIQLENELLNNPTFFSNHRTGGKDVLYFFWRKNFMDKET